MVIHLIRYFKYAVLGITLLVTTSGQSQIIDTIQVGQSLEYYERLKDKQFKYKVFAEREGVKTPERIIQSSSFEKRFGENEYIVIKHESESSNGAEGFYAVFEKNTLRPIVHIRNTHKAGTEAFDFKNDFIIGLDSIENNKTSEFQLELPFPVYNFEVDLEFYGCLPLSKGARFIIPFYHAGSKSTPPKYYELVVEKDDEIKVDGRVVEAWVLCMDYDGKQETRFWYSKDDQSFIKMEASFRGVKFFKIADFK